MADKTLTIDDLNEYQALKKHIWEYMDDHDVDDLDKSVLNAFMRDADRDLILHLYDANGII